MRVLVGCLLALAAGAALGLGCSRVSSRSGPGGPCSTSSEDDPHYSCDPSLDLLCIDTSGDRRYMCRLACEVSLTRCETGEVCCPGAIHGNATFGPEGKKYDRGCTPRKDCLVPPDAAPADVVKPDGVDAGGGDGSLGTD